jgi:hypothetical protein
MSAEPGTLVSRPGSSSSKPSSEASHLTVEHVGRDQDGYTDDRRERADACVVVPIMNEGSVPEDLLGRMEMSAKSRTRLP